MGGQHPLLQKVAIRLFEVCPQSASVERVCKAEGVIHTEMRSRLSNVTVQMLLYLSDISSIDHLVMREFVSGPPRYHLTIKGVREQLLVVEQIQDLRILE